jgi:hypothetical protein
MIMARNSYQPTVTTNMFLISLAHGIKKAPNNPHWARVVGYGPFSLWVIHKEGLCPSSGDINRLMMMMIKKSCDLLSVPS